MIELFKDQPCLTLPEWLVCVGKEYIEDELVEWYNVNEPTQVVAYYAIFVKEGINP